MARHRLGQAEEARRALAKADREPAAVTAGHPAFHPWCEGAPARELRPEAGVLLGVAPASSRG